MLPNEYQELAKSTIVNLGEDNFKDHLLNSAIGASVESSEVLQCVQKHMFCKKPFDVDHIVEECGDVLWYISYLLTTLGVSLEDCMKLNLIKTYERYHYRVDDKSREYLEKLKL